MSLDEEKREAFEKELRGVIILLFVMEALSIYVSKQFTINDVGVIISILSLWGVFEWIIKLNRVLHRIENAENFEEFIAAFFSLFLIIIQQEFLNRLKGIASKIIQFIRQHI